MRFCTVLLISLVICCCLIPACSGNRDGGRPLIVDPVEPENPDNPSNPDNPGGGTEPEPLSDIFSYPLGSVIPADRLAAVVTDQTGQKVTTDYDGDGIPNSAEVTTNPYVADYPKIVTRIAAPITMEIRVSSSSVSENHSETVEDSGVTNTITNSMEDRQYSQLNQKTTPYVTKESESSSDSHSESYGWNQSKSYSGGVSIGDFGSANASYSTSSGAHRSVADAIASSSSSETTVFADVDYTDNLDRNGVAFTDESVEKVTRNARNSAVLKKTDQIGPNAGIVRAALFIKNGSVNFPAHIRNLRCTLSFKTPAGKFLPVKTFLLRNEDWSEFEQDVYGDEELGPYTVEILDLNTAEVTNALRNGYTPQISVVSYDIARVKDSNYNPGVDNLKVVEETAKGRTATIRIVGPDMRETYRVCAFDVDSRGNVSPGISLKKALFNIMRSRVGAGESWETDRKGKQLTVADAALRWKPGVTAAERHAFGSNCDGNAWREFETYVKSYKDEYGVTRHIETIKRIDSITKYNPFDKNDNPSYDPNRLLAEEEVYKMRYWYILHNGRYYEGDINDPIWAGERYEIVCFDVGDFNTHFKSYTFSPFQSMEEVLMDTRWNTVTNADEFARSRYLGKVYRDDTIILHIALKESRFLYPSKAVGYLGTPGTSWDSGLVYSNLLTEDATIPSYYSDGIPVAFGASVQGGVNNITVHIDDSENATAYRIAVTPEGTSAPWIYCISRDALRSSYGRFTVHGAQKDTSNNAHPVLDGDYVVDVFAEGTVLNVPVSTPSINKRMLARVSKPSFESGVTVIPGNFSYIVSGATGKMEISITGGVNTEYYMAVITGPHNMPDHTAPQTYEVPLAAGANSIAARYPAGFMPNIQNGVSGLYTVEVFPVNEGCYATYKDLAAYKDRPQWVIVDFDKYSPLKSRRPQRSYALSDFNAVNLEVNFNDGSGWHPILVGNTTDSVHNYDPSTDIDCRSRKYYDRKNQIFYMTFKPPMGGAENPNFNVFAGGRDVADVYIRTRATDNYRDRYWPKNSGFAISGASGTFSNWWLHTGTSPYTDASNIESVLAGGFSPMPLTLGSADKNDYFFSPYEYRVLGVTARLDNSMYSLSSSDMTDVPANISVTNIQAAGSPNTYYSKAIGVSGIMSTYADTYDVYYRQICTEAEYEAKSADQRTAQMSAITDENVYLWSKWGETLLRRKPSCVITGLVPRTMYAVAVVGKTVTGRYSQPGFAPGLVKAVTSDMPSRPNNIAMNISGDYRSIHIGNIFANNATKYDIHWRESVYPYPAWVTQTIDADPISPKWYTINGLARNLKYDTDYDVYVTARNEYASVGSDAADSSTLFIRTRYVDTESVFTRAFWYNTAKRENGSHRWYSGIKILFNRSDLPMGTVSYQVVSGTIFADHRRQIGSDWQNDGTISEFSIPSMNSSQTVLAMDNEYIIMPYEPGWENIGSPETPEVMVAYYSERIYTSWRYTMVMKVITDHSAELTVSVTGTVPEFNFIELR